MSMRRERASWRPFAPLPMVRVPLADALGSVLAVDVIAGESVPAFPNAAMDGFAVRAGGDPRRQRRAAGALARDRRGRGRLRERQRA